MFATIRFRLVIVAWLCSGAAFAQSGSDYSTREATRRTHQAALEDPFDQARFQSYLQTLPRDGDYFVVEGDLLLTEAEVRGYLTGRTASTSRAGIKPELLVNLHDGQPDYYAAREARFTQSHDRAWFVYRSVALRTGARGDANGSACLAGGL